MNRFSIHGARGSMPTNGRTHIRHGSDTSCFSLETPQGLLVVDAGTGITRLSDRLILGKSISDMTLFFTHWHLDHVMGLPCFAPIYQRKFNLDIFSSVAGPEARNVLARLFGPPFWPVPIDECNARIRYKLLPGTFEKPCALRRYGVKITWCPIRHPQPCVAYRFETERGSMVIATDREHGNPDLDRRFIKFAAGADVLVADAQYLPAEYPSHAGWGHSTWPEAVRTAQAAGVKRLILTHHDRLRTDAQIDGIVRAARHVFPKCEAARQGMTIDL